MVPSGSRAIRGGRRLREMAGFGSPDGQRHLGINPGQRITPALESATTRRKLVRAATSRLAVVCPAQLATHRLTDLEGVA